MLKSISLRYWSFLCFLSAFLSCAWLFFKNPSPEFNPPLSTVFLIQLKHLTWEAPHHLMNDGKLPSFKKFISEGCHGHALNFPLNEEPLTRNKSLQENFHHLALTFSTDPDNVEKKLIKLDRFLEKQFEKNPKTTFFLFSTPSPQSQNEAGLFLAFGECIRKNPNEITLYPKNILSTAQYLLRKPLPLHEGGVVLFEILNDDLYFKKRIPFSL